MSENGMQMTEVVSNWKSSMHNIKFLIILLFFVFFNKLFGIPIIERFLSHRAIEYNLTVVLELKEYSIK